MKNQNEELEEQIETLSKELEIVSIKSRSIVVQEQSQHSDELTSKVERLE